MAVKAFKVPELGTVNVYKRRGSKKLRLSVTSEGQIRVTIPAWAPFRSGLDFALHKQAWIVAQQPRHDSRLQDGQRVGKYHSLHMISNSGITSIRTRVKDTELYLYYPPDLAATNPAVQNAAKVLAQKALKQQADQLLPQRLDNLAIKYGFDHKSMSVRHLKTRWGSCDSHHKLTFNYFLMQMPWELIDYVILHELVHTTELNHSPKFWAKVAEFMPDYKDRRKQLKNFQPSLISG